MLHDSEREISKGGGGKILLVFCYYEVNLSSAAVSKSQYDGKDFAEKGSESYRENDAFDNTDPTKPKGESVEKNERGGRTRNPTKKRLLIRASRARSNSGLLAVDVANKAEGYRGHAEGRKDDLPLLATGAQGQGCGRVRWMI